VIHKSKVVTHEVAARQGLEQIGDSAHLFSASPKWLAHDLALVPDMVAMIFIPEILDFKANVI
jgi:hypothetical protein